MKMAENDPVLSCARMKRGPILAVCLLGSALSVRGSATEYCNGIQVQLISLNSEIQLYKLTKKTCPPATMSVNELTDANHHFRPEVDPWGSEYRLRESGDCVEAFSVGPDHTAGTNDDVTSSTIPGSCTPTVGCSLPWSL
jgi:hypothetical protein